ncbi:N-acyl homoserine lactonase family protein [Arthrobacter sp. 35W]|uniref:N-acyl homoserine lactonase family protein n=1 Tax=Arthrobacter sp. 35W TaxID=1132441 RepID=UPI0003F8FB78|nr:N-acyl homoserine lactonase family protein [Arthrobacter sp. 35W]
MSTAKRLFLLQFGAERVPKALSLAGGPPELYWEPLTGALVETSAGWVLLDTGMSRAAHEDAEATAAYELAGRDAPNLDHEWRLAPRPPDAAGWNWILDGDPVATALAEHGLAPEDLHLAAVSHLHIDHSGGIPTLARAGVPVAIQRRELAFARSGAVGVAEGFFEPDWTEPGTVWRELDGDAELAPGVHAVATPGHTPGHMSFRVDLEDSGSWLFTADATDLAQNFLDHVPCGSWAGGTDEDAAAASSSLDRLVSLAAGGVRLVPGHDQVIANTARHPRGGHR